MAEPKLVVLQSVPEPKPTTNPYIVMLWNSLHAAGSRVLPFSWPTALLGRYDVFHVHWPENLMRGHGRLRTLIRQFLTLALLVRLRVTRTPVVRTLHNLGRHETSGWAEVALLRGVDRLTTFAVLLNDQSPPELAYPVRVIRHGHYRDWYAEFPVADPVRGRLAYVGLIRAYKGVEDLLAAFRELSDPGASLTVSGSPRTPELAAALQRQAAGDGRIELELRYVTNPRLAQRVGEAEIVVLPYRAMYNSGAALAALSLNRPVLVPSNAVNAALREEVGPGWVFTFEGTLSADVLARALKDVRGEDRAAEPDLSARDWDDAGRQHLDVYTEAVTNRRGR